MKQNTPETKSTIYLASTSPRRIQLLGEFGINAIVCPQNADEKTDKTRPQDIVVDLAKLKVANAIATKSENAIDIVTPQSEQANDGVLSKNEARGASNFKDSDIIIGADTIVWSGGKQYGKPKNNDVAIKFLSELAGKWHKVYTGVCVQKGQCQQVFFCKSSVRFKQLTQSEIVNYVLTKSPLDKAGAYGIQDNEVVAKYRGSYTNIVGLPMEKLCKVIRQMEDK